MIPQTHYAKSGAVHIAYQVIGERRLDLLWVPGGEAHGVQQWEDPAHAYFLHRLAGLARLIVMDMRSTGLSDRAPALTDLAQRMSDLHVVLDAVGSKRAVLFGYSEGGTMCQVFAAAYPRRTAGLIICGCRARYGLREDSPLMLGAIQAPTLVINRVGLPWVGKVDEVLKAIETFLAELDPTAPRIDARSGIGALTHRQRAILELIAQGRSNKEIASRLCLSEHTVHRHLANILQRLGVATRAAAVARMRSDQL
ncbi:MAG: alpha/beta fold hydrolase [Gammaproteobacteria bacterium]